MAWKLDDLIKAIGDGVQGLTATAARLLIDVARAMVPPLPRLCRRDRPRLAGDGYSPLVLRLLLYSVLFIVLLLYYGRREDLANLIYYGLHIPQVDAAADGFLLRGGVEKPGISIPGGEANPGGEITQALASQNLTQFITSAAVVAFALLILFEVTFLLGRRIAKRAGAVFEREVFLYSAAGLVTFSLYIWLLWGPLLDSVERTSDSPGWIAWAIYWVWDRYVDLLAGPNPPDPRRIDTIDRYRDRWTVLLAFFALPATLSFLRLIALVRLRTVGVLWYRARPWLAARLTRPGVRIVRRLIVLPVSLLCSGAGVVLSLFAGCVILILLADVFDPSRNLTIEGINLFPDPQSAQNAQMLTFLLRNGTDHAVVVGMRGPRVTIKLPAREPCRDVDGYERAFQAFRRGAVPPPPDTPDHRLSDELERQFADRAQEIVNRNWLPDCARLRRTGVEINFDLVGIGPAGSDGAALGASARPLRGAQIVAPGSAVVVVARERGGRDSDTVMRCGFERLVPTRASPGSGTLNELLVRVAVVGGRQVVSSDFRRYPAVLLQPTAILGAPAPKRRCGAEPAAVAVTDAEAGGSSAAPGPER